MPPRRRAPRPTDDLETLPSIGPSLAQDLRDLGVSSVAALRRRDPERLYAALNALRGQRQDPCVLYSFRCATYAARTARPRPELLLWWNWKGRTLALLLFLLQGITGPRLTAQALGSISFPNSGAPAAQAPFLRGMLLLHSFEYEDAAAAFREAEAADSTFALARWGEAMTYTHPLWNQQDTAAARAVLLRLGATPAARLARAGTPRERAWLEATEALYFAPGSKARRDTLYAAALERAAQQWPGDDEGQAFLALALMGLSQGTRNVAAYMRAGALMQDLYLRNPRHPGALHYIIHAFDDPVHAPLGLRAAREYSVIAAGADHAQHMTTHIFLALGMWRETVRQNVVAAGPDSTNWRAGHYTAWLVYGLLQEGQYAAAARHLGTMLTNLAAQPTSGRQSAMLNIRAHYVVNTEQWDGAVARATIDAPLAGPVPRAMDLYARAVGHLALGRRTAAMALLPRLDSIARTVQADTGYGGNTTVPGILADQLRARLQWNAGRHDAALALLRQAAGREDGIPAEFGPPDIVKPTHELLGELLLAADRPAEAQREFTRALELAPGRSRALLGLVRAARAAGDPAASTAALTRLRDNWADADPALPEQEELRRLAAGQ